VFLGTLFIVSLIIALNNTHKGMLFGCMITLLAMTAVMNYQKMIKKRYSGWKIYNTRQAITFANIHRGDVLLLAATTLSIIPTSYSVSYLICCAIALLKKFGLSPFQENKDKTAS